MVNTEESSMLPSPMNAFQIVSFDTKKWKKDDWFHALSQNAVRMNQNPSYVIIDIGCTKSMGSKPAILAFIKATSEYGFKFKWRRTHTVMTFADSKTVTLYWCVEVTFPTQPPVKTIIDCHDEGHIPILMSLPQMQNLCFDLKLRPDGTTLTSQVLGLYDVKVEFSQNRHLVFDMLHGPTALWNRPHHALLSATQVMVACGLGEHSVWNGQSSQLAEHGC